MIVSEDERNGRELTSGPDGKANILKNDFACCDEPLGALQDWSESYDGLIISKIYYTGDGPMITGPSATWVS